MQQSRNSSFPTVFKPDKKFTHSEEAFHALKEVSLKMKNNFGKFGKHIKNITRSDKVMPKFLQHGATLITCISGSRKDSAVLDFNPTHVYYFELTSTIANEDG